MEVEQPPRHRVLEIEAGGMQRLPGQTPEQIPRDFNAAEYFVDRHIAEGRGNQVAIEYLPVLD